MLLSGSTSLPRLAEHDGAHSLHETALAGVLVLRWGPVQLQEVPCKRLLLQEGQP